MEVDVQPSYDGSGLTPRGVNAKNSRKRPHGTCKGHRRLTWCTCRADGPRSFVCDRTLADRRREIQALTKNTRSTQAAYPVACKDIAGGVQHVHCVCMSALRSSARRAGARSRMQFPDISCLLPDSSCRNFRGAFKNVMVALQLTKSWSVRRDPNLPHEMLVRMRCWQQRVCGLASDAASPSCSRRHARSVIPRYAHSAQHTSLA
jgi:hypothetical protein